MSLVRCTGVYMILNLTNCKTYIGSAAKCLYSRRRDHWYELRKGIHYNIHLQRAWNKYGEAGFLFLVLERCNPKGCIPREQYWIDHNKSSNPLYGYNISPTAGSPLGVKHTEQTRVKVSAALKGKPKSKEHKDNIRLGKSKVRPETLVKMSRYAKNRTVEHKAKLRESARGNQNNLGKILSEETKRKIAEKAKARHRTNPGWNRKKGI